MATISLSKIESGSKYLYTNAAKGAYEFSADTVAAGTDSVQVGTVAYANNAATLTLTSSDSVEVESGLTNETSLTAVTITGGAAGSTTVHVCYALYDRDGAFSKVAGTSICSVLENTKAPVTVHMLHDHTLTAENRAKFLRLAGHYGAKIQFYNLEEREPALVAAVWEKGRDTRFSPAAFYRLLAMRVLPQTVERLIYLDSDIVVHCDIQKLWREETGENGLAAVPEAVITYGHMLAKDICTEGVVSPAAYFNSGVLVFDMERYRQHPDLCERGLSFLAAHPTYNCYDQDILNWAFSSGYRPLALRYDMFVAAERLYGSQELRPAIYHYAGGAFQIWDGTDSFNQLFSRYYQRTPWFDDAQLLEGCQDAAAAALRLCLSICKRAGGRRIDFCGSQAELPVVQQELAFFPGALFTDVTTEDGRINLPFLQQEMKRLQEEAPTLFVFVEPRFSEWHHWLSGDGFQFGRDYVDGTLLVQLLQHSSCRVLTQVFGRLGMLPVDKSAAKP